jgi:uncharacterized protein YdeI (YjbR/CyaY-like superfamily)
MEIRNAGNDNTPEDVLEALKASSLEGFFLDWSPAHRREYLNWIAEAKKPETRKKRIAKAMDMISAKCSESKAKEERTL